MLKKICITIKIVIYLTLIFCSIVAAAVLLSVYTLLNPRPKPLGIEEEQAYIRLVETLYPQQLLSPLFWDKTEAGIDKEPQVYAVSALLADLKTGSILYEKNADMLIPPASMTKLAAMYLVFQEAARGALSLDDIVPLKPSSWAVNAPTGSSLMFLAEGQRVSVRELLLGLAVVSGNDAARALADYVSGSQSAFIDRMNEEMEKLGLRYTRFVDSSGYSELNATTAREFASFARLYVNRYPDALREFHSVAEFTYPKMHNMPERSMQSKPIMQKNTNPALGVIEGASGLKTGFIPESGYNLSLTIEREQMSILSVTLGGPGQGTKQGNEYRLKDAQNLSGYAFDNFKTVYIPNDMHIPVAVIGGKPSSIFAREALDCTLTVPVFAAAVTRSIELSDFISAPVKAGDRIGKAVYTVGNVRIREIPLIADRSTQKAVFLKKTSDIVAKKIVVLLRLKQSGNK